MVTTLGGAAIPIGILLTVMGQKTTTEYAETCRPGGSVGSNTCTYERDPELKTIGPIVIGAGVAALIGGIVLWVSNRTTYEFAPSGSRRVSRGRAADFVAGRF